jgi:hypothetical protein
MLGWTLLFGLLTLPGATPMLMGSTAVEPSLTTASYVFAGLFFASLLTRFARGHA